MKCNQSRDVTTLLVTHMVPRPRATLRPCVDAIAETEGWGRGAELPLRKEASFPSHLSIVQGGIDGYMKTPLFY